MTAPAYTTDLQEWIIDSDTAAWGELTGMLAGGAPDEEDTESAIQGTNSCSQATNTTSLFSMCRILATPKTLNSGNVFLVWHGHGVATALLSYASGGLRLFVANSLDNWKGWAVGGNDVAPFPYSKWLNTPLDPTVAYEYSNGTPPSTLTLYGVGSGGQLSLAVAKGQPHIVDMIRYGRAEARMAYGEAANYATFAGFAGTNDTSTNRWGLIQATTGGYLWKGLMVLGYVNAVDFRDSNVTVFIQDCRKVYAGFNKIEVRQAGSRVDWTNVTIINTSPSTNLSPGAFEMIDAADVNIDGCSFVDMGTFLFLSSASILNSNFVRCGQITVPGCFLTNSKMLTPTVAADASALVWDANVDLDGKIDGMTFSKGTNAHHAIRLGVSAPNALTIRGVSFSGFNSSNGENDSVLHLADQGSNKTWTIGCVGCSGTVTYKKDRAGDTVNITQGVALTVHCQNSETGASIVGARVLVVAASGGPYPYQESIGLTRSGSVVTVAHTGHGMTDNDWVVIEGANEGDYNGVWQITYIGVNSYSFSIGTKTPDSPATGSPTSTFAPIQGVTNESGNISDTRTYTDDQPFTGRARKASGLPYYKSAPLSGTIDSETGASVTVQMIEEW